MNVTAKKGNNPEKWNKILDILDEKLQLGLLDVLRRVNSYHFEENILYIEPSSEEDGDYLSEPYVLEQLLLLTGDAVKVEKVELRKPQ